MENEKKLKDEKEVDSTEIEKLDIKIDTSGVLTVNMVVPSGRQDGRGERITVVYLAGRNPI